MYGYNDYAITGEQMKAIKAVEKAMKDAAKLGVHFWDNYGGMTAYNAKCIDWPRPDKNFGTPLNHSKVYELRIKNFHPGNADDDLYVKFK